MNTRLTVTALALGLAFLGGATVAQDNASTPPVVAGQTTQTWASPDAVTQLTADLSKRFHQKVMIEPGAQFDLHEWRMEETLHKTLDQLVSRANKCAWRKVYLREEQKAADASKLASWMRVLGGLEAQGLMVTDGSASKMTYVVRDVPTGPEQYRDLDKKRVPFQPEPIYIVYRLTSPLTALGISPELAAALESEQGPSAEAVMDLARQSLLAWAKMSPEERQRAARGMMDMFFNMDPDFRQQMVESQFDMILSMTPEERQNFMRQSMEMAMKLMPKLQQLGPALGGAMPQAQPQR